MEVVTKVSGLKASSTDLVVWSFLMEEWKKEFSTIIFLNNQFQILLS